jgi:hypothetical protein
VQINDPEVVAEVTTTFHAYEKALADNDVEALTAFFWDSPQALRFGVAEELYGAEAISEFRRTRKINFTDRTALREQVVTIGRDLALATLEFGVTVMGQRKHGRQSQVWVRFPELGWRVVSAHVSHKVTPGPSPAAAFSRASEQIAPLAIDPEFRDGVAANLEVAARIAAPLLAFGLADDVTPAPTFEP